jgi:phosphoglycolate phosphatase
MIGGGVRPLLERALAERGRSPGEAAMDALFARYIARYQDHIADHSRPYPGLEAALDRLAAQGFALAVCTNKYEALSLRLLDALGLSSRFAAICGQDTFPMKKPDPQVLRLTIERAGGDAAHAVMVGDSETDIRVARAAGIPVIGVDFGYTQIPMAELLPDRLIGHFDALETAVLGLLPVPADIEANGNN